MSFLIVFLIGIGLLFILAYMTKRRFGVLGLALAAGAMVSSLWVGSLTPIIARAGIVLVQPPLQSVVAAALILLPAVLLLSSGPTYRSGLQRILGSTAFALLAISLLLEPLGTVLGIDGVARPAYDQLVRYHAVIVTACLAFAVFDLLTTKTPRHKSKEKD